MEHNRIKTLLVTSLLATIMINMVSTPVARAAIGPNERFQVRFTRLHCNNANEDAWYSDGDEPYVIVATIWPTTIQIMGFPFDTYGVTVVRTRRYEDVDRGDNRYPDMTLLDQHVDRALAIVAEVVEEDNTGADAVLIAAQAAIVVAFNEARGNGINDINQLRDTVRDAMRRGVRAALNVPIPDADDAVGEPTTYTITYTALDNLADDHSTTTDKEVSGSEARYNLRFEVSRTQ